MLSESKKTNMLDGGASWLNKLKFIQDLCCHFGDKRFPKPKLIFYFSQKHFSPFIIITYRWQISQRNLVITTENTPLNRSILQDHFFYFAEYNEYIKVKPSAGTTLF